MIELPEARTIAKDLRNTILGKRILNVKTGNKPHKFAFFHEDKEQYKDMIMNKKITDIVERNFYVEIIIEDCTLTFRDGANISYHEDFSTVPDNYQFLIEFEDEKYIAVTISMYGFIGLFKTGTSDNIYYLKELNGLSPLDKQFTFALFQSLIDDTAKKLSTKAFLATDQRFLGIGNGVVQDILLNAKIHPKTKMKDLTEIEIKNLYESILKTIHEMITLNGRNTEKDIFGNPGNYQTKLSKLTYKNGCPNCKDEIIKEQYLGGTIYYCPTCQKQK